MTLGILTSGSVFGEEIIFGEEKYKYTTQSKSVNLVVLALEAEKYNKENKKYLRHYMGKHYIWQ